MTVVTDVVRLFYDDSAAFAFLPAVNYFYIYYQHTDPGTVLTALVLSGLLFSAVGFNILSQVEFESYLKSTETDDSSDDSNDPEVIDIWSLSILIGTGIGWVLLLIYSLIQLRELFGGNSVWPEVLVALSILLLFLTVSDLLLTHFLPIYTDDSLK